MRLTRDDLREVASAWLQFKKGQVKEAVIVYRRNDERRLYFIMQKDSWYYGTSSYSVFIDGCYVNGYTEDALEAIAKAFFPKEYE